MLVGIGKFFIIQAVFDRNGPYSIEYKTYHMLPIQVEKIVKYVKIFGIELT